MESRELIGDSCISSNDYLDDLIKVYNPSNGQKIHDLFIIWLINNRWSDDSINFLKNRIKNTKLDKPLYKMMMEFDLVDKKISNANPVILEDVTFDRDIDYLFLLKYFDIDDVKVKNWCLSNNKFILCKIKEFNVLIIIDIIKYNKNISSNSIKFLLNITSVSYKELIFNSILDENVLNLVYSYFITNNKEHNELVDFFIEQLRYNYIKTLIVDHHYNYCIIERLKSLKFSDGENEKRIKNFYSF